MKKKKSLAPTIFTTLRSQNAEKRVNELDNLRNTRNIFHHIVLFDKANHFLMVNQINDNL